MRPQTLSRIRDCIRGFSSEQTGQFIASRVCLAGAPLFEGRWIPDSGEIISSRSAQGMQLNCSLKEERMSRFRMLLFAVIGILMSGMTVFAQAVGEAGDNASSVSKYRALAAGIGF